MLRKWEMKHGCHKLFSTPGRFLQETGSIQENWKTISDVTIFKLEESTPLSPSSTNHDKTTPPRNPPIHQHHPEPPPLNVFRRSFLRDIFLETFLFFLTAFSDVHILVSFQPFDRAIIIQTNFPKVKFITPPTWC